MPDLGKYTFIILGAYGSTFIILFILIISFLIKSIKIKKKLNQITKERDKIDN
tara:strand:+ start:543 stop:701 length:159 start_codon:yes stop_codon:yes gene_type:complete